MDSFTIELVSNASGELFPNNTLSSSTNFLPEKVNLEGQWEVAISGISYPSMYQNIAESKFKFFDVNLQSRTWSVHFHYRHCGSHECAYSRKKQPQRNLLNSQGFSQKAKSCNYACKRFLWSCILYHRLGSRFW